VSVPRVSVDEAVNGHDARAAETFAAGFAAGRAAALAEVDAAADIVALASRAQGFIGGRDGSAQTYALFCRRAVASGVPPCAPWTIDGSEGEGDTLSAAILAAAALAGREGGAA